MAAAAVSASSLPCRRLQSRHARRALSITGLSVAECAPTAPTSRRAHVFVPMAAAAMMITAGPLCVRWPHLALPGDVQGSLLFPEPLNRDAADSHVPCTAEINGNFRPDTDS
ncbi:hypothetical protein MTO96_010095 [Rhipicephalus appendiculatus]